MEHRTGNIFQWMESNYSRLLFVVSICALLVLLIIRLALVFSYDPEFTGLDNNFIYPVMRLLQGTSIYPDPEQYPFIVNPYSPILFYCSYLVCTITGISGADPIQVYFITRAICLAADLLTMFILFRLLIRFFRISASVALVSTIAFSYLICYWSFTFMRSDSLLLMWFALLLYNLLNYIQRSRTQLLPVLALICIAALFSKQSALYMPFMIAGILLLVKKPKAAVIFFVSYAVLLFLLLWMFSNFYGEFFFSHLAGALNNRLDVHWFYLYIFKRLTESFVILPFALGCWFALRFLFIVQDDRIKAVSFAAIAAACFSLLIAFKWGSSIAYLNETMLALTVLLAHALQLAGTRSFFPKLALPLLLTATIIMVHIALQLYLYHLNDFIKDKQSYTEQKLLSEELLTDIGNEDLYIYADDVNGTFFKNLLRDRLVAPNKDAIDCCTLPDGNFDYALFRNGFETGKIKYLIYRDGRIPEKFHDISFEGFKELKRRYGFTIYTYQP